MDYHLPQISHIVANAQQQPTLIISAILQIQSSHMFSSRNGEYLGTHSLVIEWTVQDSSLTTCFIYILNITPQNRLKYLPLRPKSR
jgi:hypothetical protein